MELCCEFTWISWLVICLPIEGRKGQITPESEGLRHSIDVIKYQKEEQNK